MLVKQNEYYFVLLIPHHLQNNWIEFYNNCPQKVFDLQLNHGFL